MDGSLARAILGPGITRNTRNNDIRELVAARVEALGGCVKAISIPFDQIINTVNAYRQFLVSFVIRCN